MVLLFNNHRLIRGAVRFLSVTSLSRRGRAFSVDAPPPCQPLPLNGRPVALLEFLSVPCKSAKLHCNSGSVMPCSCTVGGPCQRPVVTGKAAARSAANKKHSRQVVLGFFVSQCSTKHIHQKPPPLSTSLINPCHLVQGTSICQVTTKKKACDFPSHRSSPCSTSKPPPTPPVR